MNPIGIMQGRLSPPVAHRLQAFPWSSWEQEFANARAVGLDLIEWLFEAEDYQRNPIWSAGGRARIRALQQESGVGVRTLCADYFMPHPFFRVSPEERESSVHVLEQLIAYAAEIGVQTILLPVLEVCEIRTLAEQDELLQALASGPLQAAERHGVRIGLETELPADHYRAVVEQANHPNLGVYYDTGNNAAQGHDIVADARVLAPLLVGVHVKDRKRGGPSVLLGQGDANFDGFFPVALAAGYQGPVILQTQFGPDYLGIARAHREYIAQRLGS